MAKKEAVRKTGLDIERPDTLGQQADGTTGIIDRNHYQLLENPSVGRLYYTAKDNKYWTGQGSECSPEALKAKYLRYLRWNYDILVAEEVAGVDALSGKKIMKKTNSLI